MMLPTLMVGLPCSGDPVWNSLSAHPVACLLGDPKFHQTDNHSRPTIIHAISPVTQGYRWQMVQDDHEPEKARDFLCA